MPFTSPLRRAALAEAGATASLAGPLVATNLTEAGLTTINVVFMGWMGSEALAAGTLGVNLYFAFVVFGIGVMIATTPLVARELGRNRHSVRDVRRSFRQGLWAGVVASVPIWAVLWQAEPIFVAMGQDPKLAAQAALYVRATMWAVLPIFWFIVIRSFMSALERPLWPLVAGAVGLPVDAALAWWLMFGGFGVPPLGLVGAGIATTVAASVGTLLLVVVLVTDRRFRRYRLFGRFWRFDAPRFAEFWRLGLPIGVMLAFEVTIFNSAAFLMGLFGTASLAAHAVAIQIASLTFMVPLGLSQAATVRVGLAYGRGSLADIRLAGWTAFSMAVAFMGLMALLMLAAPGLLIAGFLDAADPANAEAVRLAGLFLAVAALFQVFDGAQSVTAGMLRGLHDTRLPMMIAAVGYWLVGGGLAVGLAFALRLEGLGVWLGLAGGLAATSALLMARWLRLTGRGSAVVAAA
jgi:MATE family multidrug resistance protein